MRSASPMPSSDTSIGRCAGMLVGRHSISTSRVTVSRIPPSVLTPRATPTTSMETLTRIFASIITRTKSMWRAFRVRGSFWSSRIIAWRVWSEPPSFSRKIAFSPAPSRTASERALRSTVIGTVALPAPYTMAGILPSIRVRRASFLPRLERFSTCSSMVFMVYPARDTAQNGTSYTKSVAFYLKRGESDEKGGDGGPVVDALDRLAEQRRDRNMTIPPAAGESCLDGHGVRDQQALELRRLDPLDGRPGEHRVHGRRIRPARPLPAERRLRVDEGSGGVNDVVEDQDVLPLHLADDVQDLGLVLPRPALVDDREGRAEPLADGARPGHAADVRRHDHEVLEVHLADGVQENGRREEVVDRNVEEALDLRRVEVHGQNAVRARRRQQVRHQLGSDRHAGLVLLVLPRVPEVGHDGGDPGGRGAPECVQENQELHDVVVDRRARRLDDEDVGAAHVLVDLAVVLPVGGGVERAVC